VCNDLEREGYEVQPFLIPAASVNAPHKRERIWFIAYSDGARREKLNTSAITNQQDIISGYALHSNGSSEQGEYINRQGEGELTRPNSKNEFNNFQNFPTKSPICLGDDGLSDRLDSITFSKWRNESIKAGGNAIVPQVAYEIFKTIEKFEK
jgi:DNA (cytosine-5)-methyltransferase 1